MENTLAVSCNGAELIEITTSDELKYYELRIGNVAFEFDDLFDAEHMLNTIRWVKIRRIV
jgi:hypothetical protein